MPKGGAHAGQHQTFDIGGFTDHLHRPAPLEPASPSRRGGPTHFTEGGAAGLTAGTLAHRSEVRGRRPGEGGVAQKSQLFGAVVVGAVVGPGGDAGAAAKAHTAKRPVDTPAARSVGASLLASPGVSGPLGASRRAGAAAAPPAPAEAPARVGKKGGEHKPTDLGRGIITGDLPPALEPRHRVPVAQVVKEPVSGFPKPNPKYRPVLPWHTE